MPRKQRNELKAGLVVMAALAAIIAAVMWIGAMRFGTADRQVYFYIPEGSPVAGPPVGSPVQIAGKDVGAITRSWLDTDSGRAYYVADITSPSVRIYCDATATLREGMIGGFSVSVTRGGSGNEADSEQRAIRLTGGFDETLEKLTSAMEQLTTQLDDTQPDSLVAQLKTVVSNLASETDPAQAQTTVYRLRTILGEIEHLAANLRRQTSADVQDSLVARAGATLAEVQRLVAMLAVQIDATAADSLVAKAHGVVDDIAAVTASGGPRLQQLLEDAGMTMASLRSHVDNDVADLLVSLVDSGEQLRKITSDLSEVSGGARELMTINRQNIDGIVSDLSTVSANLKAASREIRRSPWRLLHTPKDGELREDNIRSAAGAFLAGAEQLDQALARLQGLMDARPGGVAADDPTLLEIHRQVTETFERYRQAEEALWQELR